MKRLRTIFAVCAAGLGMAGVAGVADASATIAPPLQQSALEHALIAAHPYKTGSTEWELVTTSEALMGKSSSGFDGALFRAGDQYAFVFYGYNSRRDFGDVVRVGFVGVPRRQLREAEAFTEKAGASYGFDASDAQFVGHSMGGYLAKAIGIHESAPEVWAFNSPGFKQRDPHRIEKLLGVGAGGDVPEIYNFNSQRDIVGLWGHQPGKVFEVETPQRHHTMAQMAAALGGEAVAEAPERRGPLKRMFNRITGSTIVQKALHNRFRAPGA
ncbi:MAG: hypothetical protein ACAH83_19675 [Alphaproteobacteria bacterium]